MKTAIAFFLFFFAFSFVAGGYAAALGEKPAMLGLMLWGIFGMVIAMLHGQALEQRPQPGARYNRRRT